MCKGTHNYKNIFYNNEKFPDTVLVRYCSFLLPSVGPMNEHESVQFMRLLEARENMSSAVGWAISLGKILRNGGKQEISSNILPLTRKLLPGVDPRLKSGYAVLVYFCEKVLNCFYSKLTG